MIGGSVAAFGTGLYSGTGRAATTVNLGKEGLSPGDTIDPYLDDHFAPGNVVHIPEGEYDYSGWGAESIGNASLIGDGAGVVLNSGDGHSHTPDFVATSGTVRVQNITFAGAAEANSSHLNFGVSAEDGATMIFDRVRRPDGQQSGGGDATGFFVHPEHAGTVIFRCCHVEGFGNNGLYASGPQKGGQGKVVVDGGLYKNNNVASIRVGSNNSVVRGAVVHHDNVPLDSDGGNNGRGIWVRFGGDDLLVEDCDVTFDNDDGDFCPILVQPRDGGGSGTIRNCRVMNRDADTAIAADDDPGPWSVRDSSVTGSGNTSIDSHFSTSGICDGSDCTSPTTDIRCDGGSPRSAGSGGSSGGSDDDSSGSDGDSDGSDGDSGGSNDDSGGSDDDSTKAAHDLVVKTFGGSGVVYSFTTDGAVEPGDTSEVGNNDAVTDNGDGTFTVEGETGNGFTDDWTLDGSISDWQAKKPSDADRLKYDLVLDGTTVSPDDLSGDTATTDAGASETAPAIDQFEVTEAKSPNPHADIVARWNVTDADGDLSMVLVQIVDASGKVVDAKRRVLGGVDAASDVNSFQITRAKNESFDVTVTAIDEAGQTAAKTRIVKESAPQRQ